MRVKELKAELNQLGASHADAVEKEDLIERLVQARLNPPPAPPTAAPPPPPAPPPTYSAADVESAFASGDGAAFEGMASNLGVDPQEAMAQANRMMSDPEGAKLMMEMQANPKVMSAAMDIAMNGEAAAEKYASDPEVLALLQKLERFNNML